MAWMDENGLLYLWDKIKAKFATLDKLNSEINTLKNSMSSLGYGDMMKSTYDKNNSGVVDNAEKVNGFTVEANVPADAKFTDTVYEHPTFEGKTVGSNINIAPAFGDTIKVPQIRRDTNGHAVTLNDVEIYMPNSEATATKAGLMSNTDKVKLNALPDSSTLESTYAKKADITGIYKYKGSVASENDLPTSGMEVGWVYDIKSASAYGSAGANVAWNGTAWDSLGEIFTITAITNAEIDTICV